MASYEAIINLVVQGERALDRIQKKIDNLYKTASDLETKKKFKGSEAAVAFVREQADELERVVSASKQQVREQEKSIIRQSRLNSAVDLYERRQRQLSRTSVVGQKQFASQIKDLEEGFKFFKDRKSATGVQAIATELGRIIEYDNEINRISERRTANQRKLFAFSKEIAKYESFGLRSGRARETLTKFESVAGTNQLKKAQQYESALRNQLRLLKDQLTEQKRVASIAPRSPIRGGTAFPGSPLALAAQQKSEEQALRAAQRGFPASPILGTATMAGSPRWVAAQEKARSAAERALKAQERAAKAAESAASKEAERIFRESRKGYPSSPIMGSASMAGSPKWIAAQERNRAAAERRAAAQRRAEERAAKIQSQVAAAAERAADKALREAQKGYPSSPILGTASIEGSPKWKASQESARQKLEKAAIAIDRAAEKALREAQKGYPSSPILGTATMVGSPRWMRAQERLRGGAGAVASETGLEAAVSRLQEARGARQAFLGDVSPAQAIDKIVREFNQGKPAENITDTFASGLKKGASRVASSAQSFATAATQAIKDVFGIASPSRFMIEIVQNLVSTYIAEIQKSYPRIQAATARAFGEEELVRPVRSLRATSRGFEFVNRPSRGFRPFREAQGFGRETAGATREFNNMMLDFRKQIAELTTQPEIYSNLLRGLPNSRLTTDLAGAASRRALATELPSFLPAQRMMGPGELEREIAKAFADYVRTIRTPDPWVGLVGDYREFIDKVVAQTQRLSAAQAALPGVRIAGALPAAEQRITSAQQQRIQRAYERSAQRQLAVLSGDAFAGAGRPSLSAANFGFMADPSRIGRLSGIGRALPPAVDVAASAADAGGRDLQGTVRQFFDRIAAGVRNAVGGIGGGGFGGGRFFGGAGGAGGRGGSAAQVAQLLGLDSLADISRVSTRELEALSGVVSEFRAVLDPTIEGFDRLDDQLRETIAGIGRQLERRAPDAGFLTRRFGPRGARGISEGLIGGAFPLLFGQGIGAAAGGALGGGLGGFAGGGLGFGLSLVGTALGTAFDQLNQAAQETGKALKYPVEAFDQLREAGLLASRQQEYYISKLIEAGRLTEAAGEIQAEIIKKIGVQGVEDLQRLGDSSSRLSKTWAEFNLQIQAAIAGPMADLLDWVNSIVNAGNSLSREAARQSDILSGLSPADRARLQEEEQRILSGANIFNEAEKRRQVAELYGSFASRATISAPAAQLTPEQLDKQKQAQAVTQELQAQVELQSKQLSLTGLTLERDGARYVNAAKAVALQEYDNKLLEIKNSWIGKIFDKEQNLAQIRIANLEYAAQLRQINEEVARRQEELYQNSLQAEMALYQQRQKSIELIVRYAEFNSGEEAGLREQLSLANNMRQQKLAEFYVEEELALIAAQKNGTYEQTATLYAERLLALEKELALEEAIAAQRIVQLQFNKALAIEDAKRQATDPFTQFRESQQLDEQFARNYFRLLQEGIAPAEAERLANFERLVSEQLRSLDVQIAIAQSTYDEAVNRGLVGDALKTYADNLERLQKARDAAREEAARGAGPAPEELPGMKIQEFISTAEEELRDLESVAISISERIGDAVGNSISSGISGLIEGTKTAQEVFADFLKSIGEILVGEAAKMIATYVAIGIARAFAFGSSPSMGGGNYFDPKTGLGVAGPNFGLAKGGVFDGAGMYAFANGGMFTNSVVSSPTLFQFADGGVTRTGLMGEAGPEAIMPLRRGADGKLGVEASLPFQRDGSQTQREEGLSSAPFQRSQSSEATRALSALAAASIPFTKSTERVMMERSERETVAAINNPKPLDVRFESQVINGVEYVSAEQHRKGMAEAAERGRSLALAALQNSVKTRKRVGMG